MIRGKTPQPIRWRSAVTLGLVAVLTGMIGVAGRAGAHDGAPSGRHVVAWNNTGSSCEICKPTS
ncbi:hypothetical protein ACIA7S_01475 [Streptomyces sp. NPDC051643]|uniref:hypothetical protein n=1 Tax=unclassified Streptomyces TaxID=2593676 RepID=UPI0033B1216D